MKTKSLITFGVFLLVLMASRAFAGVICSSDTLYVGCEGGGPCDFEDIQDAVDAAGPWDTIIVCPGYDSCDEDVLISGYKDGLTIKSTEIPDCGPNTCVNSFTIGFAPHSNHPKKVTIKGFTVDGCKSVGDGEVGIESSTDYNTIAFNHVTGCSGTNASAAIRVNVDARANNIHHNLVDYSGNCIKTEVGGTGHNIHHNCVGMCDRYGIWTYADYGQIHQNQVEWFGSAGIIIDNGADRNGVHHNEVCNDVDGFSVPSIYLFFGSDYNYVHHNTSTGIIRDDTPDPPGTTNREKKNKEEVSCPFDVCDACNGAAVIWDED
jgi:hypothetical protein